MPRPNGRDPDTSPAAFLGAKLRQARLEAGFRSQDALAAKLGFDRSVITKTETGERPPTNDVLSAWCGACGLAGVPPDWVVTLAKRGGGPVPTWFEGYLQAEAQAVTLRIWQPIIVPGLMQTADYARALFLAAQSDTSDEAIDALVTARLERQANLERPDPPDALVVLDEIVLHRLIGSPQIMHDQLVHVAELSLRPCVCVQVVPAIHGANAGLGGGMTLVSADGTVQDVLYMDGVQGQTSDKRSLVRQAAVAFERVRGDALSRGQSRELILRLADELWKA